MIPTAFAPHSEPVSAWLVLRGGAFVGYTLAQALLLVYSSHRYVILWRWWRRCRRRPGCIAAPVDLPLVTVQLPVYNERLVVERLIDAVAALDYPRERLEIQVLDDSTDDTRAIAAVAVARHRAQGLDIVHLHRPERAGYKAGALAAGLARARGELLAVFDADFVPPPGFLRDLAPRFADPAVGMVQSRWGHLNRGRSRLTAAQATLLDAHFLLEHPTRMASGLFFNFNGTAGVWRRRCIEEAGGWSSDTLTEDLDLSYRAQLAGWRFEFAPATVARAELPIELSALKSQQRRWTKGSIQTARKLLPTLLRAPLPARVKVEAIVHLTSNLTFPTLLVVALLLPPILFGPSAAPAWLVWVLQAAVLALGLVPVILFLAAGRRAAGGRAREVLWDVPAALVLGVGLSVNNARAALEGLGGPIGDWDRTPKTGDGGARPLREGYRARSAGGGTELALAIFFTLVGTVAFLGHERRAIPFLVLLVTGFGAMGIGSLRSGRGFARPAGVR